MHKFLLNNFNTAIAVIRFAEQARLHKLCVMKKSFLQLPLKYSQQLFFPKKTSLKPGSLKFK